MGALASNSGASICDVLIGRSQHFDPRQLPPDARHVEANVPVATHREEVKDNPADAVAS
jgi:hypothetical protein